LEVVQVGSRLTPDLEQIAEASGGDQADLRAAMLQQRVGGDGTAMAKVHHVVDSDAIVAERQRNPLHDRLGGVARRRRDLMHRQTSRRLIEKVDVGKRAANVYTNADPLHAGSN